MIRARTSIALAIVTATHITGIALHGCATSRTEPRPAAVPGEERFRDLGDGTVHDELSHLTWSKSANLPDFKASWDGQTWDEAVAFVRSMNEGDKPNFGRTDWRLPTVDELTGLIRGFWRQTTGGERQAQNFLNALGFTGLAPDERGGWRKTGYGPFQSVAEAAYWSATEARSGAAAEGHAGQPTLVDDQDGDMAPRAWVVDTGGNVFPLPKTARKRVWPVRGPNPLSGQVAADNFPASDIYDPRRPVTLKAKELSVGHRPGLNLITVSALRLELNAHIRGRVRSTGLNVADLNNMRPRKELDHVWSPPPTGLLDRDAVEPFNRNNHSSTNFEALIHSSNNRHSGR